MPDTSRLILLVRHGRTAFNAEGRLRGLADPELDETGIAQAHATALALQPVGLLAVVSSPLQRAVRTAEIIADSSGVSHDIDAAFNDRDYGPWTGHAKADVIAQWGSVDAAPGVESSATVLARAMAALDALIRSSDRPIAVVTHDAVIRPILARIHPDLAPDVETGSVGYAGFDSTALAAEANRMTYTRRWLAETKPVWEPVACPTCAGTSTGRLCRTHLLEAGIDAASAADTSSYLAGLDRRLRLLVDSMTQNGTPSTPDADASWVEAVAWFAGWSFPLALSSDDSNRINP